MVSASHHGRRRGRLRQRRLGCRPQSPAAQPPWVSPPHRATVRGSLPPQPLHARTAPKSRFVRWSPHSSGGATARALRSRTGQPTRRPGASSSTRGPRRRPRPGQLAVPAVPARGRSRSVPLAVGWQTRASPSRPGVLPGPHSMLRVAALALARSQVRLSTSDCPRCTGSRTCTTWPAQAWQRNHLHLLLRLLCQCRTASGSSMVGVSGAEALRPGPVLPGPPRAAQMPTRGASCLCMPPAQRAPTLRYASPLLCLVLSRRAVPFSAPPVAFALLPVLHVANVCASLSAGAH
mmetsp:Transcript_116528/g.362073  ORF Transcript_116528/g.362073 Transcript_116528/m.362073 type:complete len:292 (+) Transcript_116528:743-1618(+)